MKYKFTEDEKVTDGRVEVVPTTQAKIIIKKNTSQREKITEDKIDSKIDAVVNERILKLVQIGLKHELTIENMMQYFREINKTKLYELGRYFSDSNISEINDMLQYLHKTGVLTRDKNNWYSLKSK